MTIYNPSADAAFATRAAGLIDLMRRQQDLVSQLRSLAEQQESYFCADRAGELLEHMKRRQQIVDDIERVQSRVAALLPEDVDVVEALGEEQAARFKELRDSATDDLARIAHIDKQSQAAVRRLRDEVAARLGQVAAGQDAVAGYGRSQTPSAGANRYTDRSA